MPTAFSILPERFADGRHTAIERGLAAAGWRLQRGFGMPRGPDDMLVTWTLHRGPKETAARSFEAAGGRVLVCEEAYFRLVNGEAHFALALHDHNGAGQWQVGGPQRWRSFNIPLKPWRQGGTHILLREQRGIGSTRMASPPLWHDGAARRLKSLTGRPLLFRAHPKSRLYRETAAAQPSLEEALADCHAVVTWASAIAARALVAGVPVFYEAPALICAGACQRGLEGIEAPRHPDRLPALERLAWAQWSHAEIASGAPFASLRAG